jgi:hypothetical protein
MYIETSLDKVDTNFIPNIYQVIRCVLLTTLPEHIVNMDHPDTYNKFIAQYVLKYKYSYNKAQKYAEKVILESVHELVKCVIHNLINGTDLNKKFLVHIYSKPK